MFLSTLILFTPLNPFLNFLYLNDFRQLSYNLGKSANIILSVIIPAVRGRELEEGQYFMVFSQKCV